MKNRKIPSPGKKYAKRKIREMVEAFTGVINKMNPKQLRSVIKTAEQFSSTNCGWDAYWMKDVIIKFAEDSIKEQKRALSKSKTSNKQP